MPIITCSCGAKLKVSDKLRGKTVKCPKCGELIELIQYFNETIESSDEPLEQFLEQFDDQLAVFKPRKKTGNLPSLKNHPPLCMRKLFPVTNP